MVDKNKLLLKSGKKGAKEKVVGPLSKEASCAVDAPAVFNISSTGKTLA